MMARNHLPVLGLLLLCCFASIITETTYKCQDPKQPLGARIRDLMGRITLEEKIGQMTQIERVVATADVMKKYFIGSVLSGGGSVPAHQASTGTWVNMANGIQKGALSTRLGIPMIYGIDVVHGNNNVYKATISPHNVGLGVTRIHMQPSFGSGHNLEAPKLVADQSHDPNGESTVNSSSCNIGFMHEITFSADDKPKLLSQGIQGFVYCQSGKQLTPIEDTTYTRGHKLGMVKSILCKLGWTLTVPTHIFLVCFVKAAVAFKKNMVYFLAELGLKQYAMIMDASAVYAARCTMNKTPFWNETLRLHTGFCESQLMECAK